MSTDPAAPVLLYVEDEFLIQDMLVTALEEAGFSVLVANDGNQALEILASQSQAMHGLITDINLGTGPDGWDVSRTARELVSGVPVVYVSAASEHEWTSRGVPNSVMINKPFVPAQVVVAISSLLVVSD
jgi:DNA-binding response OmpR family regulator